MKKTTEFFKRWETNTGSISYSSFFFSWDPFCFRDTLNDQCYSGDGGANCEYCLPEWIGPEGEPVYLTFTSDDTNNYDGFLFEYQLGLIIFIIHSYIVAISAIS